MRKLIVLFLTTLALHISAYDASSDTHCATTTDSEYCTGCDSASTERYLIINHNVGVSGSEECEGAALESIYYSCCTAECPRGFYKVYSDYQCRPCHTSCQYCDGSTASDCTSCETGKYLVVANHYTYTGTCDTCPAGSAKEYNRCITTKVCPAGYIARTIDSDYDECEPCPLTGTCS